jgi:hypothetical protein
MAEKEMEFLQTYVPAMKLMSGKGKENSLKFQISEIKHEKGEVIALVKALTENVNFSEEQKFERFFRIHQLLISSDAEANINEFIQVCDNYFNLNT